MNAGIKVFLKAFLPAPLLKTGQVGQDFIRKRYARITSQRLVRRLERQPGSIFKKPPRAGYSRGINFYARRDLIDAIAKAIYDYKLYHGVYPKLMTPQRLNEKITWAKFFSELRVPESGDKLSTEKFIPPELEGAISCPTVVWRSAFFQLPNNGEVAAGDYYLKANHGSGFVKRLSYPLSDQDRSAAEECTKKWLESAYGLQHGEWWYSCFKKEIFLEESVCDEENSVAVMFHVFHGTVHMITACKKSRSGTVEKSLWLDSDFVPLPQCSEAPRLDISFAFETKRTLKHLASCIGSQFRYVRVDFLLDHAERPFLGELTFAPNNGLMCWPEQLDFWLGGKWILDDAVGSNAPWLET
jgi:hypothetical protein